MKQYLLYLEAKEAIINKLQLNDEQKKEIQELVDKYPQKASKIDWNKKDLTYGAITSTLKEISKKAVKQGSLGGLVEGKDYILFGEFETKISKYMGYIPLNHNASRVIAQEKIGGCEGKWCTAFQKSSSHWDRYVKKDKKILVYGVSEDANLNDNQKIALEFSSAGKLLGLWDRLDKKIKTKVFFEN